MTAMLLEPKFLLTLLLMGTIVYITYLSKRSATASDYFVGGEASAGLQTVQQLAETI